MSRLSPGPAFPPGAAAPAPDPAPSAATLRTAGAGRREGVVWALVLTAVLLGGLARAWSLRWVCDDAFISFRYARHFAEGQGLVYNVGERVEGYTNLAWTLLISGAIRLGLSPVPASQGLGLVFYLALALLLAAWSARRAPQRGRFLPLAAVLVLLLDDFQVWATGGLETMMFAALAVAAALLARTQRPGAAWAVGAVSSLLLLTRPDGLLLGLCACLALRNRARVLRAVGLLGLTAAAWAAWKLGYYGELFPTAFHSKSALSPYYSQGLLYVALYFAKNWMLGPALLLAWLAARRARPTLAVGFLATGLLFTAYVAHSGGDFMFARRLVPAVPFLLLALEERLAVVPARVLRLGLCAALLLAALLPYPIYRDGRWRISGIADERHFYPPQAVETRRRQAELVGQALRGTPARVLFEGGMCMFGYYSELPYLVEMTGLTQYSLAKLPLRERGFVGHEKQPDDRWLDDHRIHLIVSQAWPPLGPSGALRHDEVYFGDLVRARVWLYSDEVMDSLRRHPQVRFVPIEQLVERVRGQMQSLPHAGALQLYEQLVRYYFRHAGPRGAEAAESLTRLLESKRP